MYAIINKTVFFRIIDTRIKGGENERNKTLECYKYDEGPMFFNIIKFILPLIATTLLQQLYHSADIITVGFSSEPDAVGAIGSTSTYLALIRNLFIGFSVGANVVVARHIGAKNKDGTSRAVHTSICMSLIFGVIGSVLGISFSRIVFEAMDLTGNILTLALRYTYIFLACMPFLSLTNFLSAILHAQGNTKTPLYVLSLTGILNIILNVIFIFIFNMSVEGVAIATAVSNLTSAVVLWVYLAMNASSGAIRGVGKSTVATIITLLGTCVFRVIWIFTAYEYFGTLESVYVSYPISWIITGAVSFMVIVYLVNKKIIESKQNIDNDCLR